MVTFVYLYTHVNVSSFYIQITVHIFEHCAFFEVIVARTQILYKA